MFSIKPTTPEAKEKSKFRQSSVWKHFRYILKKERKVDQITGKPLYKGFQVHHLDMSLQNYKDLNPDKFRTYNRTTHEVIHWLYKYPNWEEVLENISRDLKIMDNLNHRQKENTLFD